MFQLKSLVDFRQEEISSKGGGKYLDLTDSDQKRIYDYARKNRDSVVILRDSTTGALRSIRQRASND